LSAPINITNFSGLENYQGKPQRQWSDLAIVRSTPALFGLFSLVTIWANSLNRSGGFIHPRTAAWYAKSEVTFSDTIAAVRRVLWCPPDLSMSRHNRGYVEIPAALLWRRECPALC
jgi:hypothetical protein